MNLMLSLLLLSFVLLSISEWPQVHLEKVEKSRKTRAAAPDGFGDMKSPKIRRMECEKDMIYVYPTILFNQTLICR